MEQMLLPTKFRTCYKCSYEGETIDIRCPRCRSTKMRTNGQTRTLGAVLVVLGGIIMAMMAAATLWTMNMVAQSGKPGAGRFTGTKDQLVVFYAFFAIIFFIGLTGFMAGAWQVVFGRRNKVLLWTMLAIAAVFFIAGTIFRVVTGE